MSGKEKTLDSSHGFSNDGKYPLTLNLHSTNTVADPDGFITLFNKEADILQDVIITTSRLGETRVYENSSNQEDPYIFVNGGYELQVNKTQKNYTYTIHPSFAVDFSFLEELDDKTKERAFSLLTGIQPRITIVGKIKDTSITSGLQPTTQMTLGCNNVLAFTVDPKKTCPGTISNVDLTYREEMGKYYLQGIHAKSLEVPHPDGKRYFKPLVRAVLPESYATVGLELGEYAACADRSLPRKKDIQEFASATVYLREFDPFGHYTL